MSGARSRPDYEERGFILIFAIAVCLMLALVGAMFGRSVQSALRSTNAGIEIAKASALADGGLAIGGELIRAGSGPVSRICSVAGAGLIALTIEDEDGKVSLNSNNTALHVALFTGLGVSRDEAERYADLIADYRDAIVQSGRRGRKRRLMPLPDRRSARAIRTSKRSPSWTAS